MIKVISTVAGLTFMASSVLAGPSIPVHIIGEERTVIQSEKTGTLNVPSSELGFFKVLQNSTLASDAILVLDDQINDMEATAEHTFVKKLRSQVDSDILALGVNGTEIHRLGFIKLFDQLTVKPDTRASEALGRMKDFLPELRSVDIVKLNYGYEIVKVTTFVKNTASITCYNRLALNVRLNVEEPTGLLRDIVFATNNHHRNRFFYELKNDPSAEVPGTDDAAFAACKAQLQ